MVAQQDCGKIELCLGTHACAASAVDRQPAGLVPSLMLIVAQVFVVAAPLVLAR